MGKDDVAELEKLFGAQSFSASASLTASTERTIKDDDKMKLFVIEAKRAQNIVIGLAQFKNYPSASVYLGAVCSLRTLNGFFTADRLENLQSLLPSPTEAKKLPQAADSKHPAELFCLAAVELYPDLPRRISCFIFCENFNDTCSSLVLKMNKIIDACNQV